MKKTVHTRHRCCWHLKKVIESRHPTYSWVQRCCHCGREQLKEAKAPVPLIEGHGPYLDREKP